MKDNAIVFLAIISLCLHILLCKGICLPLPQLLFLKMYCVTISIPHSVHDYYIQVGYSVIVWEKKVEKNVRRI